MDPATFVASIVPLFDGFLQHNVHGPAGYKAARIEVPATYPRGDCRQGRGHHEHLTAMSTVERKGNGRKAPRACQVVDPDMIGVYEIRTFREWPHVPVDLMPLLERMFASGETPNTLGRQFNKLWKRALFPMGIPMELAEMDELSSLWELMEGLQTHPPLQSDIALPSGTRVN